jgi:transposase
MAARKGPKKVNKYSLELKRAAVRMSEADGVQVKDVADALDIHPFMLSRWRKQAREGQLVERPAKAKKAAPPPKPARKPRIPSPGEISKLAKLRKEVEQLREENEFLKKFDRFRAQLRAKGSPSSRGSGDDSQ